MNKTLLLIICDFLLLNLLALTRWEKAEPPQGKRTPVAEIAANAVTKEQELFETMRQSLADEKAVRDDLAQRLAAADAAVAAREQSLTQARLERTKLAEDRQAVAGRLQEAQRAVTDLSQKVGAATQEASMTRDQLAQLQRELADKQAEADRQRRELADREKLLSDAQRQNQVLAMAVVVAEQEKKTLREAADALKGQVEVERSERLRVQETTTQLAQGVGQLTERSAELTKELREGRPINANLIFGDFMANRVTADFAATRKGFLGPATRTKNASTVLVTDGRQVYALLHVADTVFSLEENGLDWEALTIELAKAGGPRQAAAGLHFLAHDPRIVVLPLELSQATMLGARVYPLAADPFKFPEAVLIDGGGRGYGEVGFKLEPGETGFVRVDNRLFKRVFGDFAPKRGDLVFAKTGELLGLMVTNDYCALLKDFAPHKTIRAGTDIRGQATGALLDELIARVRALPIKLQ